MSPSLTAALARLDAGKEARSFVTYLQDKVIMVKRIMCNAEMERCRLVTVAG